MKTCVNLRWPRSLCPWNAFCPSEITASQWDEGRVMGQLKGEGCLGDEAVMKQNVLKMGKDKRTEFNLRPLWFPFCLTVRGCWRLLHRLFHQFRAVSFAAVFSQTSPACAETGFIQTTPTSTDTQSDECTHKDSACTLYCRQTWEQTVYRQTGWTNL